MALAPDAISALNFNENLVIVTPSSTTAQVMDPKKRQVATGLVVWKGVNSIYDVDSTITYFTEDSFQLNYDSVVYTCVWTKNVIFSEPPLS